MADTSSLHGFGSKGPSMPWQEVSIVDQRREFVRLAMQTEANRHALMTNTSRILTRCNERRPGPVKQYSASDRAYMTAAPRREVPDFMCFFKFNVKQSF